jgi:hypothetical protein
MFMQILNVFKFYLRNHPYKKGQFLAREENQEALETRPLSALRLSRGFFSPVWPKMKSQVFRNLMRRR